MDDFDEMERIFRMTDEEILAEVIAEGKDPAEEARIVREIFDRALAEVAARSSNGGE